MNPKSKSFQAAVRAMAQEGGNPKEAATLMEGMRILADVQPPVTVFEAQALCAVYWRCNRLPSVERTNWARFFAKLIGKEVEKAESLLAGRQVTASEQIRSLRAFSQRLKAMNKLEGFSLYVAADLLKLAPPGSRLGHFFVLHD